MARIAVLRGPSPRRPRAVPKATAADRAAAYRPAPTCTAPYRPAPPRTTRYHPVPPGMARYHPVPSGTAPYRPEMILMDVADVPEYAVDVASIPRTPR